jgi:hypothetical protein
VFIGRANRAAGYIWVFSIRVITVAFATQRALVKIMYHESIIASTMLISEREAARFGYDAGDRC